MEISLTTDYDKQWLNCVSAIDPKCLSSIKYLTKVCGLNSLPAIYITLLGSIYFS